MMNAFPSVQRIIKDGDTMHMQGDSGMTLRDYFAAKAMLGLIEGYDHEMRMKSADPKDRTGFDDVPGEGRSMYVTTMAEEAYLIADAMIKARSQ